MANPSRDTIDNILTDIESSSTAAASQRVESSEEYLSRASRLVFSNNGTIRAPHWSLAPSRALNITSYSTLQPPQAPPSLSIKTAGGGGSDGGGGARSPPTFPLSSSPSAANSRFNTVAQRPANPRPPAAAAANFEDPESASMDYTVVGAVPTHYNDFSHAKGQELARNLREEGWAVPHHETDEGGAHGEHRARAGDYTVVGAVPTHYKSGLSGGLSPPLNPIHLGADEASQWAVGSTPASDAKQYHYHLQTNLAYAHLDVPSGASIPPPVPSHEQAFSNYKDVISSSRAVANSSVSDKSPDGSSNLPPFAPPKSPPNRAVSPARVASPLLSPRENADYRAMSPCEMFDSPLQALDRRPLSPLFAQDGMSSPPPLSPKTYLVSNDVPPPEAIYKTLQEAEPSYNYIATSPPSGLAKPRKPPAAVTSAALGIALHPSSSHDSLPADDPSPTLQQPPPKQPPSKQPPPPVMPRPKPPTIAIPTNDFSNELFTSQSAPAKPVFISPRGPLSPQRSPQAPKTALPPHAPSPRSAASQPLATEEGYSECGPGAATAAADDFYDNPIAAPAPLSKGRSVEELPPAPLEAPRPAIPPRPRDPAPDPFGSVRGAPSLPPKPASGTIRGAPASFSNAAAWQSQPDLSSVGSKPAQPLPSSITSQLGSAQSLSAGAGPPLPARNNAPLLPPRKPSSQPTPALYTRRHMTQTMFQHLQFKAQSQRGAPPPVVYNITITSNDTGVRLLVEGVMSDTPGEYLLSKVIARQRMESVAPFFRLCYRHSDFDQWIDEELPIGIQIPPQSSVNLILAQRLLKTPLQHFYQSEKFVSFLYAQLRDSVSSGNYIVSSESVATRLAALFRHLTNEDYDTFSLSACLPPQFCANSASKRYWHVRIARAQQRVKSMNKIAAMVTFLQLLEDSPTYGCTVFEFGPQPSHVLTALGIAQDGVFLFSAPSSTDKERVFEFHPFSQVSDILESSVGIQVALSNKTILFNCSNALKRAQVLDLFDDYRVIYRAQLNPALVEHCDLSGLPSLDIFESPTPRQPPDPEYSRAELIKREYSKLTALAKLRSPSILVGGGPATNIATGMDRFYEQIDAAIDGDPQEELDMSFLQLQANELSIICQALKESVLYKPAEGRKFVENFPWKSLNVSGNPTLNEESSLTALTKLFEHPCPLTSLHAASNNWQGAKAEVMLGKLVGGKSALEELSLHHNNLGTNAAIAILAALKPESKLRNLNIRSCEVGDHFFVSLSQNMRERRCNITALDLAYNPITDDGLKAFVHAHAINPIISRLVLSHTKITHVGVKSLIECFISTKCVEHLSLGYTKLTGKVADSIAQLLAVSYCPLQFLNIEGCDLDHKGCETIAHAIRENRILRKIVVGDNDWDKSAMKALTSSLMLNTSVADLTLRNTPKIGSRGYKFLWEAIQFDIRLKALDLTSATLEAADYAGLAECLGSNNFLETLILSSQPTLSNEKILSGFVEKLMAYPNKSLRRLDMENCGFNNRNLDKMCDIIRNPGCQIQKISLRGNKFNIVGIVALLKALLDSPIVYMNLAGHPMDVNDALLIDSYDRAVGTALRTVVIDNMSSA